MFERLILILSFTFSSFYLFAQFSSQWGETEKIKLSNAQFLGSDGVNYFLVNTAKEKRYYSDAKYELLLINQKMNLKKAVEFKLPKKENKSLEKFIMIGDRLTALLMSESNDKREYYLEGISKKTLTRDGTKVKVSEISLSDKIPTSHHVIQSPDRSLMAIVFCYSRFSSNKPFIAVKVFNSELSEVWSSSRTDFEFIESRITFKHLSLDNSGNLFVACRNAESKKQTTKNDKNEIVYSVAQITESGKKVVNEKISVDRSENIQPIFSSDHDKVRLISLYDKVTEKSPEGIQIVTMEWGSGKKAEVNKIKLEEGALDSMFIRGTKKKIAKNEEEILSMTGNINQLKDVVFLEDGSYYIILQREFIYSYNANMTFQDEEVFFTVPGGTNGYVNYMTNGILICSLSKGDSLEKMMPIQKSQLSTNDNGIKIGYTLFQDKDDICLLFNDDINNLSSGSSGTLDIYSPQVNKSVLAYVKLSKNGELEKKEILVAKEVGFIPHVQMFFSKGNKEFFTVQSRGKRLQFGIIRKS